ncbi:uncharacterized protein LOC117027343 [Rhinolophus ferrumequinum]|uniref:uncharacterized protein LOC117027343 n=1 Tax=Rhinolophus ferrumequinum TaxID=59479 RepID=UPI00140FF0F7|nr:uncharacterized protein LOC117027343 [Rhinolophus ferrumequinum]
MPLVTSLLSLLFEKFAALAQLGAGKGTSGRWRWHIRPGRTARAADGLQGRLPPPSRNLLGPLPAPSADGDSGPAEERLAKETPSATKEQRTPAHNGPGCGPGGDFAKLLRPRGEDRGWPSTAPPCHRGFVSPPISCPAPGLQEQPSLQTGGVSAAGTAPRLHFEGVLGARVMYVTEAVNGREGPWQRELGQSLWGPGLQGGGAAWSS